jgi:hypothetical protein
MTKEGEREVQCKLRILQYADRAGHVAKTVPKNPSHQTMGLISALRTSIKSIFHSKSRFVKSVRSSHCGPNPFASSSCKAMVSADREYVIL